MNIAIILAGGSGSRFSQTSIKQNIVLDDGLSMLEKSTLAFYNNQHIHQVIVVKNDSTNIVNLADKTFLQKYSKFNKTIDFINGSSERYLSVMNAILYIKNKYSDVVKNVFIHDAARPFISQPVIDECANKILDHDAVLVVTKVHDTIKSYDPTKEPSKITTIPRNTLYAAQTPQSFRFDLISKAYDNLNQQIKYKDITDDFSLLEKFCNDFSFCIVDGSQKNKKITTQEDLC
jgi:2-C-methyl-D-erythritol 4-phosphate cytidylyltransferase